MSETQTIEHRNVGYNWGYSIEVEKVVPVEGTRASAKSTQKFSIGGNCETYLEARKQMGLARNDVSEEVQKQ